MGNFSWGFICRNLCLTQSALITNHQRVYGGDANVLILTYIKLCDIKVCYFAITTNDIQRPHETRIPVDRYNGLINYF
jgi:hypothetical protein